MTRRVPDDVIRRKHALLPSRERLLDESFTNVHVIPADNTPTEGTQ